MDNNIKEIWAVMRIRLAAPVPRQCIMLSDDAGVIAMDDAIYIGVPDRSVFGLEASGWEFVKLYVPKDGAPFTLTDLLEPPATSTVWLSPV